MFLLFWVCTLPDASLGARGRTLLAGQHPRQAHPHPAGRRRSDEQYSWLPVYRLIAGSPTPLLAIRVRVPLALKRQLCPCYFYLMCAATLVEVCSVVLSGVVVWYFVFSIYWIILLFVMLCYSLSLFLFCSIMPKQLCTLLLDKKKATGL